MEYITHVYEVMARAFMPNLLISISLLAWILAVCGYGLGVLNFIKRRLGFELDSRSLYTLLSVLLGVGILCFFVQVWNLFSPLYKAVSVVALLLGLALFWIHKSAIVNARLALSFVLSLAIVLPVSFFGDSVSDTINYHIQIVTWIQQSPVIFGLGNIHGRLGFNGFIYNFYALSDVSQLFALRSFIGNEIVYCSFLTAALYPFLRQNQSPRALPFYELFLLCSLLPFLFVIKGYEFRGLYCEGIGAVFGISLFTLLLFIYQHKNNTHLGNRLFALGFVLALCASMIKVANTALVVGVVLYFIALRGRAILTAPYIKAYLWLGVFSCIFVLPWAMKGIMTSGMIAYPASVGYIRSLPWAVSEAQRDGEVCWIMSWARAPGIACREVLASNAWLANWFHVQGRYAHFAYALLASLILLPLLLGARRKYMGGESCSDCALHCKGFILSFVCIVLGVAFWFITGPDPRFGMAYIIPLLALLFAYNLALTQGFTRWLLWISLLAFLISIAPMFRLERHFLVILWAVGLIIAFKNPALSHHRFYLPLFICLSLYGALNFYRKDFREALFPVKILPVHVEARHTDSGVLLYVRTDNPTEHSSAIDYEARPMTPYFNPHIEQGEFMGRTMYFIPHKEQE